MTTLSDKIAAAKSAPRPSIDVTVSLNKDLSEAVEALASELEAAKKSNDDRLGAPTAASVLQGKIDALLLEDVDTLVTMRFTRLPGDVWARLGRESLPDATNLLDRELRYNLIEVCKKAAQYVADDGTAYGHVVDGEDVTAPTVHRATDTNPAPTNEWLEMFALMSGPEFTAIVDALYMLNAWGPVKRVNELKKVSASLTA